MAEASKQSPEQQPARASRRGILIVASLATVILLAGFLFFSIFWVSCYKVLYGESYRECLRSSEVEDDLEADREQGLRDTYANRCNRPLRSCVLHADVTVNKSGEKCLSAVWPNEATEFFDFQEMAYCDDK